MIAVKPPSERSPALLTMAGYGGTLAAVRCLGRAGIAVTVASDRAGLPAAWSKWTARRVRCPDTRDAQRFVDWLLEFGSREPGHVLYPTSDDLALLFARHRAVLGTWFHLYQPPQAGVLAALDKASLAAAALKVGVETPITYFVQNDSDLQRVARDARFPLLIKPRTQVMFRTQNKGVRVQRREELGDAYRSYMRANTYLPALLAERPEIARPMLQEYHSEAEGNIRSVCGFVDETGDLFAARASRKVLQHPRRVGIGVCFEDAALDPGDARGIAGLCREIGYFGVFEAEFIRVGDRALLIDFNPRYYNQMAFEIARGLPLPLLAYAAAIGDRATLEGAVCEARATGGPHDAVCCHRSVFWTSILLQRVFGQASADDVRTWRRWYAAHHEHIVDVAFDRDDVLPGLMDVALRLRPALRHPRAFFRATVLNR